MAMTNLDGSTPTLLYPHEDLDALRNNTITTHDPVYELGQVAHFVTLQALHINTVPSRERTFAIANGKTGSDIFPNKQRFSDLVNEIGYRAPRSVTVDPSRITEGEDYTDRALGVDEQSPQRFCKPLHGSHGWGAKVTDTPQDALEFVAGQDEVYLVQSFEKPKQDWRYILHRDKHQLASGTQDGWHVTLKVERPVVTGDGSHTVSELLEADEKVPETARQKYLKHHTDTALHIPTDGEVMELLNTGNREQGAYSVPSDPAEVGNLDKFMVQFVRDLETHLGTTLGTLCVDIGILDPEALTASYDHERMKQAVVFYEHQIPFGIKSYSRSMPEGIRWSWADNLVPSSRRRDFIEKQVYLNLVRSVIRSGKWLRQNSD